MNIKYSFGVLMLAAAGLTVATSFTSCSEDDYSISETQVVKSITTGEASVTAISAVTTGNVQDLTSLSSSSYQVGTVFSTSADPTVGGSKQTGTIDSEGNVVATLSGLVEGTTYYYATYVTLQGRVTKYGEVKSFVATDADVATAEATEISACKALLNGQVDGADDDMSATTIGFKLSNESSLANSIDIPVDEAAATFSKVVSGLIPGTTYYFAAYSKVGDNYLLGTTQSFTTAEQTMEYVDLGLSVLWAKCNIGAEVESEIGALAGFGDQSFFNMSADVNEYTPWDISGTDDDFVANLNIDGDALMKSSSPTAEQMAELIEKTTQTAETVNGVNGIRFTAKNGNSIFLPFTGYRNGVESVNNGEGYYWSGNVSPINGIYGQSLKLSADGAANSVSMLSLGLGVRTVRKYSKLTVDNSKLVVGDLESNGRIRIELYNDFGPSKNDPSIDPSSIKFNKNMVVTFRISGIDGNMKQGTPETHAAGLEYEEANRGPAQYWSKFEMTKYDALIKGDGVYAVWMETEQPATGAVVFTIDIKDLANDAVDPSQIKAEIVSIALDADVEQIINPAPVSFQNKDGNTVDGRIEIYNEYGNGGSVAKGWYNNSLKFIGLCFVEFSISGIDGNLKPNASANYKTELSFADADWDPQFWGGTSYGAANVTGDGTYQVYGILPSQCEGAVVWTIELYDLWKDLVDTDKVKVSINKVITPGKL